MNTQPKDDRPKREVTRDEFRMCAVMAGWDPRTIDLFLKRVCKVREYTGVGTEELRVTDW